MNGWYDDFDSLYDLYDNDEPTLKIENFMYCIQQYGTKANPRLLHVTLTDLSKVPATENCYDKKYEIATYDFKNSFDFINNFKLVNDKTIAQMMCDANNWDYSILPIYPEWLSSLGEMVVRNFATDEEVLKAVKQADKISKELWEKDKKEMLEENDTEGLKLYEQIEKEFPEL